MSPGPDTLPPSSPLAGFHPAVGEWFARAFGAPTDCQNEAWPAIRSGQNVLVAAPTGSGKTLAAFLGALRVRESRLEQGCDSLVLPGFVQRAVHHVTGSSAPRRCGR